MSPRGQPISKPGLDRALILALIELETNLRGKPVWVTDLHPFLKDPDEQYMPRYGALVDAMVEVSQGVFRPEILSLVTFIYQSDSRGQVLIDDYKYKFWLDEAMLYPRR